MRTGIEVADGVFIPYAQVASIAITDQGLYKVTLSNGQSVEFARKEPFIRIKNYILMGHPVMDKIDPPGGKHDK